MFQDDINAVAKAAAGKANLLGKNPAGYVISSFMAGLYIAIGSMLMGIVGGNMAGLPAQKLVCGIIFSIGLCCVTVGGAELFTGNNLVMAVGGLKKSVTWAQVAKVWIVCYLGNLLGSVVAAGIFTMTGIPAGGAVGEFFANAAAAKVSGAPMQLFAKAVMCNVLVCVAIWCGTRLKSEGAKIAMNFCCVGTFVTCGFEHSIANMTFLSVAMMNPQGAAVTMGGSLYNLLIVTLGNMVGGIVFVALPYYFISRNAEK